MREPPTKEPIHRYFGSMYGKTGSDFTYAFIHAASRYDHKDVKACENMPSKLKSHLSSELDWNLSRSVTQDNYKFIVAIHCMLGGKLFKKIPSFAIYLRGTTPSAPITEMTKSVMALFFKAEVVQVLSSDLSLIGENTYTLVQTFEEWTSKLDA